MKKYLEELKLRLNAAVIKHISKPQSFPRNRVVLDEDVFNKIIDELTNKTQKIKNMKFRGLYFTTGGLDEITRLVSWKWGWRVSQSCTCLFLGFCYLSWTVE